MTNVAWDGLYELPLAKSVLILMVAEQELSLLLFLYHCPIENHLVIEHLIYRLYSIIGLYTKKP